MCGPMSTASPTAPFGRCGPTRLGENSRETVGRDCLQVVPHFRKGLLAKVFDGSSSLFATGAMI